MLDLNKIVNDEIQKAYLKGRREIASELRDMLSKKITIMHIKLICK